MAENGQANVKDQMRRLAEALPADATWDDVMYRIYVRQAIESGLKDSTAGRTVAVHDVRAKFGLPA